MKTPRVHLKDLLAVARKQIEGMSKRPDVGTGLPYSIERLEASLKRVLDLDAQQERAKKALVALTEQLNDAAFKLRDETNRNISAAEVRYGKYGPELSVVGAQPLTGTHRPPERKKGAAEPSTGATEAA